jgi:tRNA pseudouridine55 synthase
MFILIDKPLGISSFDVIRKLRKKLWIKKMGHSWTLDPLATWCLLIATDNSTKLLPLLENSYKEYIFTVRLDGKSPSYDLWTEIEKVRPRKYGTKK